jgi:hypothetical protein
VQQKPGERRILGVNGADLGVNDANFEGGNGMKKEGNGQKAWGERARINGNFLVCR